MNKSVFTQNTRCHIPAQSFCGCAVQQGLPWGGGVFFSLCLLAFFLMWLPLQARAAAHTPLQAIEVAQQAIDTADYSLFTQVVDVERIMREGAADVLTSLRDEAKAGRLGKESQALGALLGALNLEDPNQMNMLTQLVVSDARAMVASGISGGYFAGNPNGKTSFKGIGGLLAGVSQDAKRLIPGQLLKQQGDSAVVSAVLEDSGAGAFPLELRMKQVNDVWRVMGVNNIKNLVQNAVKRAQ